MICDERDRKATIPLRKFLKAQGFESKIPVFEGDAATVRQSNQDLLSTCDAVVIFYGAGDEAWKRSVDSELRKASGYRTSKTPLATFTYLSEPATDDKTELIELEEPTLDQCLVRLFGGSVRRFRQHGFWQGEAVTQAAAAAGTRLVNPFPGLRPFHENEEHLFFGRESQIDTMVDKLAATRFLAVVGTSGSGKSSLVNCGLKPALHRGLNGLRRNVVAHGAISSRQRSHQGDGASALAKPGGLFHSQDFEGLSVEEIVEATLRMSKLGLGRHLRAGRTRRETRTCW